VLWGVLVGAGTGSMAGVLAATVANRWFVARRGLVTGVLTAASATGQLVFLPLLASLAVNQGWRWASLTVALSALVAIPVVALLMRDDPARIGLRPFGAAADYRPAARIGNPFAAAFGGLTRGLRSVDFWLLASSFFICGASTNGLIGTHLIPASVDHGIAEVTAASMLALIGLFDVIGTTVSGWLTDRLDSRWLLFWYYGLRGLSLLFLPFALSSSYLVLLAFIVFYGLDWVATVPPTIALCTRIFGREQAAIVFGWVFAAHQFGSAFAAFGAGALRTWLGDYQVTFITAGLLCLIASGLVIRIGSAARGESPALPRAPEAA
jgi:sugar phosphate permease